MGSVRLAKMTPSPSPSRDQMGAVRFDGLYLSFGAAPRMNAVEDEDAFVEARAARVGVPRFRLARVLY